MTMNTTRATFDSSLPRLVTAVRDIAGDLDFSALRVIRDMNGHLYLVVPDAWQDETLTSLSARLDTDLGAYSPGARNVVQRQRDVLSGTALLDEPYLLTWVDDTPVHVIERRAVGQDWVQQPKAASAHSPRFVFYSLKGGVGRSTALMLWGRRLARQGKTVLIVDLDLEAPGLGPHTLTDEERPQWGTLDWLVEDLVDNDPDCLLPDMVAESFLTETPGFWVAPALGQKSNEDPGNVLAKLARAYLDTPDGNFADRVRRLISALEDQVHPDVVLIDSRAGLHESVAANLLHLDAEVLLFAVDLPATWEGYRYLFGHLRQLVTHSARAHDTSDWRERFQMVQARCLMTAEEKRHFASSAYGVWTDTLYDSAPADGDILEVMPPFSFDEYDEQAPHWPLAILRSEHLEALNPLTHLASVGEAAIEEAFKELFAGLEERLETLTGDAE